MLLFLLRFKGSCLYGGTFVILPDFKIAKVNAKGCSKVIQGWRDRIPYRTGGFEYGYKLHH